MVEIKYITHNYMTKTTQNDDALVNDENRLARDMAEGWFKFEKPGDKVGGTVRDIFELPSRDGMPAQRVFTLETTDGELWNVGLKRTQYILSRTDMLQIGDQLGVKFDKEIPAKVKGHHPAKSLVIFSKLVGERTGMTASAVPLPKPEEEEEIVEEIA